MISRPPAGEQYDAGGYRPGHPGVPPNRATSGNLDRPYLRRLEPAAPERSLPRWLWPALGLAVIVAGVVALISFNFGGDDTSVGPGLVNPTVDQLAQATVQIIGLDAAGDPLCSGSGTFVSSDGMILTNAHVVTRDVVCDFRSIGVAVTTDAGRRPELRYEADLLAVDTDLDLAVIRVARTIDPNQAVPASFAALALGDSDQVRIGDSLRIFGYPEIGGETITFTNGSVSGFTAQAGIGDRALIKTDATIAGGNSGGAAVDSVGRLVGVPTKARASENGPAVDCRPLVDTNRDGVVDNDDNCVTIGGFLNGLRPVNLARPVIEQARTATPRAFAAPSLTVPVDPGSIVMSHPRFSLGETGDAPVEIVRTAEADIPEICLFVDWAGIPKGAQWDAVWFLNGAAVDNYSLIGQSWEFGDRGANFWMCAQNADSGLSPGLYELGFFVGGHLIFAEGIVVTEEPAELVSTAWLNSTDTELCGLAINPKGSGPVGLNELPAGQTIPPGETVAVDLPPGMVDVAAYDCDGLAVADSGGAAGGIPITTDEDRIYEISAPEPGSDGDPSGAGASGTDEE